MLGRDPELPILCWYGAIEITGFTIFWNERVRVNSGVLNIEFWCS